MKKEETENISGEGETGEIRNSEHCRREGKGRHYGEKKKKLEGTVS